MPDVNDPRLKHYGPRLDRRAAFMARLVRKGIIKFPTHHLDSNCEYEQDVTANRI